MARLTAGVAPRYRVERLIADGGMGCVFEGFDTQLRRRVALKVLKLDQASAVTAERFKREGRTQAQTSHPNIVQLFDAIETPNGLLVLVMEYVDGSTLQRALLQGPLSLSLVRGIGSQLLLALQRAHDQGITHRDIKPGNIFLRGTEVLLGDFGIASASDPDETTLTVPGRQIGTPMYMAPEQRLGYAADERSDLYSVGLVLRQCATGRAPTDARISGKEAWRGVPSDLRDVIERAVVEDPDKRWQSATEFRTALEATSRPFRTWRRLGLLAAGLISLSLVAEYWRPVLCRLTDWRAACREPQRLRPADLAILPFTGPGSDEPGPRLSRLVGQNLEWFSVIKLMPMSQAAAWWDSLPTARKDQPLPGADKYTEGSIARSAGTIDVTLEVRDSLGRLYESIRATGDTGQLQRLARSLADSIVCKVFTRDCATFRSIAFRPVDVQASAEFFAGKDAVANGNWAAGERHFEVALARDPGFMPAAWELMIARRYQRKDYSADLQFIARNIDSLPAFYRRLAIASLTPDLRERLRRYEDVVRDSRQNGTALLLYTNELFHRGALVGRPLLVTVDTLTQLAATEPDMNHSSTYDMAWWGDLRLGREREAKRDLEQREALGPPPGDRYKPFQRLGTYARFAPWKADVARFILLRSPDKATLTSLADFARLGTIMDVPNEQLALGKILASKGLTGPQRAAGLLGLAGAHLMLGRPSAAFTQMDAASVLLGTPEMQLQQREWPLHLSALGLLDDTTRVADARRWLETAPLHGNARVRALYALGRDAIARGDRVRADSLVALLQSMPDSTPTATRHAALLAAELAGVRGDPESAISGSEVIYMRDTTTVHLSPFARAVTYLDRGRWQAALRQYDAADREWLWYESADFDGWPVGPPQEGEFDAILSVYARLLRGELAAERGNITLACGHLARVRELWRGAEPVMRPYQARAQRAWEAAGCH